MNELEILCPDKDGFEKMLAELKPSSPIKWDYYKCTYVVDDSEDCVLKYKNGFENFKSSLREIYDFSTAILRGTPRLCYAFYIVYNGLRYVIDSEEPTGNPYSCTMSTHPEYNFLKFATYFGISDTAAYNYKDLGLLVDPETLEFYPVFKGYSLSLLIEMLAYVKSVHSCSDNLIKGYLEDLITVVPKDTTIQAMRYYRKIMALWRKLKDPFQYDDVRCNIDTHTKVSDVIDYYDKLIQEQEQNKLKALTAKVESKDKPKAEELVGNDVLIKQLREQITELKKTTVPNLGNCDGCVYSCVNLNKCRCCRRYKDLKDLFKSE